MVFLLFFLLRVKSLLYLPSAGQLKKKIRFLLPFETSFLLLLMIEARDYDGHEARST